LAVIATLSKGYDLDYIWKQVDQGAAKDAAGYYIQASESGGEPPGRWWGPGAQALGRRPGQGGGGGRKPGAPTIPAKPHWYSGDQRLDRVLSALNSGTEPSAAQLAAEWNVSRRTAQRIIRAARALLGEWRGAVRGIAR